MPEIALEELFNEDPGLTSLNKFIQMLVSFMSWIKGFGHQGRRK